MRKLTILWLLASSIAINVYSQTVSLDNTFGQNGKTIIPNTSDISFFDFDNHGNIVAVGYTLKGGGKYDLTITKTNADGIIDVNFGNGGISKVTDYDNSSPLGFKITNDNKIIVIGGFTEIQFQGIETIMMQFNENGSIDENFGNNGKVNLNFNTGDIVSLNCESDDFMLLGRREGEITNINGNLYYTLTGYSISKYDYNGNLDENFGENGKAHLPNYISPYSIKVLNNGSIAIAGTYNQFPNAELGFCKLTSMGELDTGFANDGIWHKNIMQDFDLDHESFYRIFEDNNGNLILSGWGLSTCGQGWSGAFLSKFSSNGILDLGFGEDGFYCSNTGISLISSIGDKYVIVGYQNSGYQNNGYKMTIVNNDGKSGKEVYTCGIYYLQDMKLQGNNKVILGGGHQMNGANFALERAIIDLETSIKLNKYSANDLIIFPNPAKENLYFNNETMFEIIDIQGKILLRSESPVKSVNVGNLETGIYFVRFENSVHKFIKE